MKRIAFICYGLLLLLASCSNESKPDETMAMDSTAVTIHDNLSEEQRLMLDSIINLVDSSYRDYSLLHSTLNDVCVSLPASPEKDSIFDVINTIQQKKLEILMELDRTQIAVLNTHTATLHQLVRQFEQKPAILNRIARTTEKLKGYISTIVRIGTFLLAQQVIKPASEPPSTDK